MLEAELYAVNNNFEKAIEYYEKSIQAADKNNFDYVKAISNERAAILYSSKKLNKHSQLYVTDAWKAYKK